MNLAPDPVTLRQLQYAVAVAETLNFRRAAELLRACRSPRCRPARRSSRTRSASACSSAAAAACSSRPPARTSSARARRVLLERRRPARRGRAAPRSAGRRAAHRRHPHDRAVRCCRRVAPRLRAAFPRLSFVWTEDKTEVLLERLARGELDAALLALGSRASRRSPQARGRRAIRFVLALPRGHELAQRHGAGRSRASSPARPCSCSTTGTASATRRWRSARAPGRRSWATAPPACRRWCRWWPAAPA